MILPVQRQIHDRVVEVIRSHFGLTAVPPFAVETPPSRALGDLAVPVAFQLARTLRKAPKAIAQELMTALGDIPGVARVAAAPNGYLNVFLDRRAFLLPRLRQEVALEAAALEKTIVEHTAINPNKAAHIGHLRNAALGDTIARVLRFRGTPVEVQNYIDDLGVQVADIIVGFRDLEQATLDDVRKIADTTRFDYYCWDLYSRVTEWYDQDKTNLARRNAALHDLEAGGNDTSAMGAFIAERIVRAHLATMARLNIAYDLLTHEGDILRLQFWAHAFDLLKAQNAVFLQTEGKLAGCWVMPIEEGDGSSASDEEGDVKEKVIVRSNGVVTYIGKDLANQFWKLGLLGRDFRYRRFAVQADQRVLWSTTSGATFATAGSRCRPISACCGRRRRPMVKRMLHRSDTPRGSTTSSTRGRCICRRCSARRCARSAAPRKPRTPFISRTRWSRSRTRPPASLATRSRRTARRRANRSSRCRGGKGSASRSTICWTC
jgi:arginyl-tRNA synthetase